MFNHSWNNTWFNWYLLTSLTLHCVSFSWRCLTICKYSPIESFNYTIYNRSGCVVINLLLFTCCIKYFIKREFKTVFQIFNLRCFYSNCFLIKKFMSMRCTKSFLPFIDWSESANDFNIGCCSYFLRTWH
jgi:hypothetical protein